jgi:hypothetical protein
MATKNKPISQVESAPVDVVAIGTEINLEDAIADQLLDDIDWSKVKAAMLTKVKQRFFTWLTSGGDRPVNISQFPELAVLPSGDEQEKAA